MSTDRPRTLVVGENDAVLPLAADGTNVERFCGMVAVSQSMKDVFAMVRRVAPHVRTALITGETGTGKELVARALHAMGSRRNGRLVTVNCSALVETLFESELFGHVRGAFTGATEHKAGLFEAADGGTLFLDEIGELPAAAQAKLLRVLEDGEVHRVGSLEPRRVDVRVIAATNRDLPREVQSGRFRSDLFYRLNVVQLHLPSLKTRPEDVPTLADSFLNDFSQRLGKRFVGLTAGAVRRLADTAWDGNVRQLRNAIERACIVADAEWINESDLLDVATPLDAATREPETTRGAAVLPMPARSTMRLADIEREHIVRVLNQVRGNKAVAARMLGVSRRAFYRQLERHGLHQRVTVGARADGADAVVLERAS